MVAYLIIPRLYLAQEVAHSANFSNGCSSSSLRYSSLPKLFDLFLLILFPPSSPLSLSLSLSQSSFFFDFLRLDTWKVFIHRFEPIHLLSIIRFFGTVVEKFPTLRSTTLVTIIMHIAHIEDIANFFERRDVKRLLHDWRESVINASVSNGQRSC